ncbi:MAG: hypothetical protein K2I56_04815 [Muribaculaceae bacterium]|nr:hypothetical protein [Muribaculaceae bacterium]
MNTCHKQILLPNLPQLDCLESPDAVINLLDEKGTRRTIESVNWREQYPYQPLTVFTAAHSGKNIYVDFFVRCNFLRAENFTNQSPVSEDCCVEFFVQPEEGAEYWNFEFNCIGTVNASHRIRRPEPTRLSDDEIDRIRRYGSCGTRPFRELEGIFTWNLLTVIPLDLIGTEYKGEPLKMKGNFYKCASAASQPHYMSWNPIDTPKPDFHRPEFFGDIILL